MDRFSGTSPVSIANGHDLDVTAGNECDGEPAAQERSLTDLARQLGLSVRGRHMRALDAIARSRMLLSDSYDRLNRVEAALSRLADGADQEKLAIDRMLASSRPGLSSSNGEPRQPAADPGGRIERAAILRSRLSALAGVLALMEDEIAEVHQELANGDRDSPQARQHRRIANEARLLARDAREVRRRFGL